MQLLVWLQRVQTGLAQGANKSGAEGLAFLQQIAHAARVLLFQPLLMHVHQVLLTVSSLPISPNVGDEVSGNMLPAMPHPADNATESERVEWLQLNLLLQFQTVYKLALCNMAVYQSTYSRRRQPVERLRGRGTVSPPCDANLDLPPPRGEGGSRPLRI